MLESNNHVPNHRPRASRRDQLTAIVAVLLVGGTLLGSPAAYAQTEGTDSSGATAPTHEIIAPIEDLNYVFEELDGASQYDEADDYEVLTLSADVNFAKDSAKLSSRANKILGDASAKWKDMGLTSIEITGHTDSVKGRVDNDKLSRDRAAAVEKVLAKKFPDAKISSTGKGPQEPRADEKGLDGQELERARAMNRRVEVIVSFPRTNE